MVPRMPPLIGDDLTTAFTLVLECYDRQMLEQLIRGRFAIRLEWIVREDGLAKQVAELFEFTNRHRLTGRLLKEMAEYPPPKVKLRPLAEKCPPDPDEPNRPVAALIKDAVRAFDEVPVLLNEGEVRARFAPFIAAYQEAATHIDLLRRYKGLHDCLHVMQLKFREIGRAAEDLAEDPTEAGSLNSYADELDEAVAGDDTTPGLDELLAGLPNQGPEQTWIRNLRRAIGRLREAAASHDPEPAEDGIRLIGRILDRDSVRIHGIILRQSEVIPLPSLVFSLRVIRDTPTAPDVRTRLADGLAALEAVHLKFVLLVAEHTAWQNLDNSLRVALDSWYEMLAVDRRRAADRSLVAVGAHGAPIDEDDSQTVYANRLLEDWPDVAEKFAEVRARAAQGRRLDRLIRYGTEMQTAGAAGDFGRVFDVFEPFAQEALRRFIEVDKSLLKLAYDLTRIGESLRAVLEVMQR